LELILVLLFLNFNVAKGFNKLICFI